MIKPTPRSLIFVGDVFLPTSVDARLQLNGEIVLNLEGPITQRGKPALGKVNLRMEENHLVESFGRAPLAACLANNHVLDYGEEGFLDTLQALDAIGTRWFGAGREEDNYANPLIVDIEGVSVALLGYSSAVGTIYAESGGLGVAPVELARIRKDIAAARERGAARVIVCLHWGAENVYLPRPEDVEIAHELLNSGADLLIGHHAHRIQPFERVNGRYVFYGLGNCVFPDFEGPAFYADSGRPTVNKKTTWNRWNLRSLAVSYNPATKDMQVYRLEFRGNRLEMARWRREPRPTQLRAGPLYGKLYKASYLGGKLKAKLVRWALRPYVPWPVNPKARLSLWRSRLWKH